MGTNGSKLSMKLEVIAIPVTDIDRAKEFYSRLGWRLDADFSRGEFRGVQFTPPGSDSSIHFGKNVTSAPPGSAQHNFLVVDDIDAAREEIAKHGVEVSGVFHFDDQQKLVAGPAPDHATYGSYASFSDPDGNVWLLQEVTKRLPGRIDASHAAFDSEGQLANALRRAEKAHGEHEKRLGHRDEDWPSWYATYIAAEQAGAELPL